MIIRINNYDFFFQGAAGSTPSRLHSQWNTCPNIITHPSPPLTDDR